MFFSDSNNSPPLRSDTSSTVGGVTGVVLQYRLPKGRSFVPLLDAQRAIRTVRANAKEWKLDPKDIGIMGFSAGAEPSAPAAVGVGVLR